MIDDQKKHIICQVDRLMKHDLIQLIQIHIVANGLLGLMKETQDGLSLDLDLITDQNIISKMYAHVEQLCAKLSINDDCEDN